MKLFRLLVLLMAVLPTGPTPAFGNPGLPPSQGGSGGVVPYVAPVILNSLTAVGQTGQPFVLQINATQNPTSYSAAGLPAGLAINLGTGVISGIPTTAGPSNVIVRATNATGFGEATIVFTITAPAVPVITSPLTASGITGQAFSYQIMATLSPTSFSATGLPAGLSINTATGFIAGIPSVEGPFNVILRATNATSFGEATLVLTVTTLGAPVITSPIDLTGEVGQPFVYQIIATGNPTSYGLSGGAVPGLSVNATTGVVSGVPTTAANWGMKVTAYNNNGAGFRGLNINVRPGLAAALDDDGLVVSYGGNLPWLNQTIIATNGGDSAQSGAITHNQTSSFQTTVTGPYGLSFYWRADCELTADFVKFEIDGVEQSRLSGNTGWYHPSVIVPTGNHTLKWSYVKNGSVSSGLDAAWVDQIVLGSAVSSVASDTAVSGAVGTFLTYSPLGTFSPISYNVSGTLPSGLLYSGPGNIVAGTPSRPGIWPVTVGSTNAYGTGTAVVTFTILSSFQSWASANSLAGSSALTTADPDRDGWNNLLEMAFNQNPMVRNPAFQIISVDPATKRLRATFTRKAQHLDLIYQVQVATTTAGPWTTIGESRDGLATIVSGGAAVTETGSGVITVTVTDTVAPPAAPKRFMRMKIIQQ